MHKQRGKIRGTITDQIIFRLDFLTLKDLVLLKISPATMKWKTIPQQNIYRSIRTASLVGGKMKNIFNIFNSLTSVNFDLPDLHLRRLLVT